MLIPSKVLPTGEDVRHQILNTTQRIAYGRGVSAVRMDEIAHELGISKKTLYTHFRSKEELLKAMLTARYLRHRGRFQAVLANKELNDTAALRELMRLSWQASSEWSPDALQDMRRKAPYLWATYQELHEALVYKLLQQELARGQAQGWLRQDVRMDIFLDMFLNRTGYELRSEESQPLDYSMRDVQETYFALLFDGILT